MPSTFNAPNGRFWAADFASGSDLYVSMTGAWLFRQPGMDAVVARPIVDAIRRQRSRLLHGDLADGPRTVVVQAKGARLDPLHFDAHLEIWDGTLDEVLAEHFPAQHGRPSSNAPLGGPKHGRADEWDVGPRNGVEDGPLGLAGWIAIAVVVGLVVLVFALWGRQIYAVWMGLMNLVIAGFLIWMAVRVWRWMKG